VAQQARREAMRLENGVERTMRDNPLAVGAAAMALGTEVGLALPHSRREDQLLGGMRDHLIDKAEHLAEDAVGTVREKIEGAVEQIGASQQGRDESSGGGSGKESKERNEGREART